MSTREQLLISIADTIQDYRAGEIPKPTPEHVEHWVEQFDANVQVRILLEMDHILKRTYFSRERVTEFLKGLSTIKNRRRRSIRVLARCEIPKIQGRGKSQAEMLDLFNKLLASPVWLWD